MHLVVVTPVGPGHRDYISRCAESVRKMKMGPFNRITHNFVPDPKGRLGRSRARNIGMVEADWYFFLDADDVVYPEAAERIQLASTATFGQIVLNGKESKRNIWPLTRKDLFVYGPLGTLAMGFFCRADAARELRFNESMDVGEDFDFYMRLPDFFKVKQPLVSIDYWQGKGANGGWAIACRKVIDSYKEVAA